LVVELDAGSLNVDPPLVSWWQATPVPPALMGFSNIGRLAQEPAVFADPAGSRPSGMTEVF
jgi:hypothetical protein